MTIEGHLAELAEKHRHLDKQIQDEMRRPGSDDLQIKRLKLEKLKIKEQIEQIRHITRH